MSCPSDLDWTRWFAGELTDERRAQIVAHLDGCADCRAVCAALAPADASEERYRLGEEVARGGMGRILRAHDRVLDRSVALKLPHAGAQARFAREIAILSRLAHPSIVTVLDAGQLDADTPFFAMPLLAGRTLAAEVAAGADALLAVIPAISAMAHAHSLGIVHRDLKPTNLFIGAFGECTVLDWGLAVVVGEDAGERGGTEGYASPEQQQGRTPSPDHDVYALGAVLRFVLRDRPMPPELRSIIARATAPSGSRYATATELLADVQRHLSHGRVEAHTYSAREVAARWLRRHRTVAAALATAVVAATAVGAWSVRRIIDERDRAQEAERMGRAARTRTHELTAFLLDEVNHSVAELGRLDLATNLLTGLDRHVSSAPPTFGDPAEDVQQIELRGLMADIAIAKGEHEQALRYLAPVYATLARLGPDTALTAYLWCESAMRTAQVRRAKGDPAAARTALESCITQIARIPAQISLRYPRFDTAHTLATANVALGDLQRDEGDGDAALAAYRAAGSALAGPEPEDDRIAVERLVQRAAVEQRLGTLAQFRHQPREAEVHYRTAITHAEAAIARRESEASAQWLVAQLQVALAISAGERGDLATKRALVAQAARIAEPLFAIDSTHDEHARWMTILWRAQAELGAPAEAPALFERILEVSRRRVQLQPRATQAWRDLAVDLTATATTFAATNDPRAATLCTEAIAAMQQRQQLAGKADSDLALTLIHCGEIAYALRDVPLAQQRRTDAMAASRDYGSDPGMLGAYATALAAFLTDASPAARTTQRSELARVWADLVAANAQDVMDSVRDIAPWFTPP